MSDKESIGPVVLRDEGLDGIIMSLVADGYEVKGPVLRDGAVVYSGVCSISDLPKGARDAQGPGSYKVSNDDSGALFNHALGPHSWKKYLHPPRLRLWSATRDGKGFTVNADVEAAPKFAFIGVRPCELAAIAIQDKVFIAGDHQNTAYQARRENLFVVAVNCTTPGGTCFCASMDTGPKAKAGFDLALTEVTEGADRYFVVESGSARGEALLSGAAREPAGERQLKAAQEAVAAAEKHMGRSLEMGGIKDLLYNNYDHPEWEAVAKRCLACANCTIVCPTCFCSNVEDATDLTGGNAERWRVWDFCFTKNFTYIHGGAARPSVRARYRHWMVHKLASWQDQFGSPGCVGCGRCITWCPVGIDITEEAAAIRGNPAVKDTGAK